MCLRVSYTPYSIAFWRCGLASDQRPSGWMKSRKGQQHGASRAISMHPIILKHAKHELHEHDEGLHVCVPRDYEPSVFSYHTSTYIFGIQNVFHSVKISFNHISLSWLIQIAFLFSFPKGSETSCALFPLEHKKHLTRTHPCPVQMHRNHNTNLVHFHSLIFTLWFSCQRASWDFCVCSLFWAIQSKLTLGVPDRAFKVHLSVRSNMN